MASNTVFRCVAPLLLIGLALGCQRKSDNANVAATGNRRVGDSGGGDRRPSDGDQSGIEQGTFDEELVIDMSTSLGVAAYRASGILISMALNVPSAKQVDPLQIRWFRAGADYGVDATYGALGAFPLYDRITSLGGQAIVVLSESHGYPPAGSASGWPGDGGDWSNWEAIAGSAAFIAASAGENYIWDIWNEPSFSTFWDRSQAQFFETWRRGVLAVRVQEPGATISGPSIHLYDAAYLRAFLTYAKAANVLPDVLSWHEFGPSWGLAGPESIVAHVTEMKAYLTQEGIGISRFHINEMIGLEEALLPGAAVWFYANIERAGVDGVRTCYDDGGESSCFNATLDGLIDPATRLPRSTWWTHRAYSKITGELVPVIPSPSFDGVVGKDSTAVQSRALIANHTDTAQIVRLRFVNMDSVAFLTSCVRFTADEIPNSRDLPLAAPIRTVEADRSLVGNELLITLPATPAWEAWEIELRPCP